MPKSRLIVAAMLDLQNLRELGRGAGMGRERKEKIFSSPSLPPPFPFRLIPSPLVALSTLPNLPLLLKSKMAAIAFARPQNTPASHARGGGGREVGWGREGGGLGISPVKFLS